MKQIKLMILMGVLFLGAAHASEKTLNIFKANNTVQRILVSNIDSVKISRADNQLMVYLADLTTQTFQLSMVDSMNYSSGDYSAPTVQTTSVDYKYKKDMVLCQANVTDDGGCPIIERGIVWSFSPNPTVDDNVVSTGSTGGKYYNYITGVGRGETYYIRSFVSNCYGTTYGDEETVSTLTGNVTYYLAVDESASFYDRLVTALDSACYYYNRYTTFEANIYVYQNDGIPTAQASYHGSIGFGPSTSYMWVGTTMHEFAHYFGSGTATASRNMMSTGTWAGPVAQALCQELTGQTLNGDGTHYWPTGINYASEVSGQTDLINHAKLIQAMLVEDCGLPTSGW